MKSKKIEENKKKRGIIYVIIFSLVILMVNILSNSYGLTDVGDYLGVAKGFSGNFVTQMRSTHSWIYGILLSIPLKIWNSLIFIKLLNVLWLIIIGFYLFKTTGDKKTFFVYAISPIVWYMSVWISPILPASFLLLVAYNNLKRYEINHNYRNLIYSGLLLGLSTLLWDSMIFISVFFTLCFFFNKKIKEMLVFLVPLIAVFSIRFAVDYLLFGFPLFSLFRVFGGSLLHSLKLGNYSYNILFTVKDYLLLFLAISPIFIYLFYRLIKEDRKRYGAEIWFIILSLLLFLNIPQARYLLVLAPIVILILSNKINTRNKLVLNVVLSLLLIIIFLTPYFGSTYESKLTKEMNIISADFPNQEFLAGDSNNPDLAMNLAMNYWGKDVKEIINWKEYELWLKNETDYQSYRVQSKSKENISRNLWFEFGLSKSVERDFSHIRYAINTGESEEINKLGFKLVKSYGTLSVFEK
jgi:hypothetical protein